MLFESWAIRLKIVAYYLENSQSTIAGAQIHIYSDLSAITLRKWKGFKFLTIELNKQEIWYRWGFPFKLLFVFNAKHYVVKTPEEASSIHKIITESQAAPLLPVPVDSTKTSVSNVIKMKVGIKIVSLNAAGLLNMVKRNRLSRFLRQQKVDIICLQETNLKTSEAKFLHYIHKGDLYHASSGLRSAGVMVGIKFGIPWVLEQEILDLVGRFVILHGLLCSQEITLVGLYAPNRKKNTFWEDLRHQISSCNTKEVIMLGDFNAVIDNKVDHSRDSSSVEIPKSFHLSAETWDLIDIWWEWISDVMDYLFLLHRHLSYSWIDMILVSRGLFARMAKPDIGFRHLSDHASISLV